MTVVRLGAFADYADDDEPRIAAVTVEQFAILDDGARVVLGARLRARLAASPS